jgi:hypothetical protein
MRGGRLQQTLQFQGHPIAPALEEIMETTTLRSEFVCHHKAALDVALNCYRVWMHQCGRAPNVVGRSVGRYRAELLHVCFSFRLYTQQRCQQQAYSIYVLTPLKCPIGHMKTPSKCSILHDTPTRGVYCRAQRSHDILDFYELSIYLELQFEIIELYAITHFFSTSVQVYAM